MLLIQQIPYNDGNRLLFIVHQYQFNLSYCKWSIEWNRDTWKKNTKINCNWYDHNSQHTKHRQVDTGSSQLNGNYHLKYLLILSKKKAKKLTNPKNIQSTPVHTSHAVNYWTDNIQVQS